MAANVLYRTVWPKTSRLSLKQTRGLHSCLTGARVSWGGLATCSQSVVWPSFIGNTLRLCFLGRISRRRSDGHLHAPLSAVNPTGCSFHRRAHEQELTKRHERELNDLTAAHSRDTQNMLSDFNKAQEVLKDKISALQIL